MDCSILGFPFLHYLLEFAHIHVHWVDDTIQPSHLLSPPAPPALYLFQHQGLFQWVNYSHQVAKVFELQLQHQSFQWKFRVELLSKGLTRVLSSTTVKKHQFFRCSAFFMVQLSHPYMTTGKTIALTRWTCIGKMVFLLFNMLPRLEIPFLPRSKHLLISRFQSPSAVILEPKKIKFVTVSIVSPSICHEVLGPNAMIFIFWMLTFKPAFHSPLSPSSRGYLVPLCFLP